MLRILREPITHFMIAGGLVFLIYGMLTRGDADPRQITVSDEMAAALRKDFGRRFGRAPTPDEGEALVRQWVEDEVLVREARLLGLDRGDPIVRRRLVQAMRFFIEDSAALADPSPADLAAWLAEHPNDYLRPARLAFEQVFFNSSRGLPEAEAAAQKAKGTAALSAGVTGDPFIHGHRLPLSDRKQLERTFGAELASALFDLEGERWHGPLRSSFGYHLVRITQRQPERTPELAEVERQVRRDWLAEEQRRVTRRRIASLSERYAIAGANVGP